MSAAFTDFVRDVLIDGAVRLIALLPEDMAEVTEAAGKYKLDFDDAYQYAAASTFSFEIAKIKRSGAHHTEASERDEFVRVPRGISAGVSAYAHRHRRLTNMVNLDSLSVWPRKKS